jgi:hypothetical protein
LAHAVGRQKNSGAYFAERRCLFVNRHLKSLREESIGREQAAYSTTNNCNVGPRAAHRQLLHAGHVVSSHKLKQSCHHKDAGQTRLYWEDVLNA